MEENKVLNTAIYMRVSTDEQAKEGFSINAQKDKLTKYAMARDWEIYDYYVDEVSGKNIQDRPDMVRLLKDLQNGKINNVLVYKIDRLTRSTKNLIELTELFKKCSCEFNSLMESIDTSSATGRMFLKIVGIFAEFERENLAERVSFGYEQKTREGNYTNTNGVYGYDYHIGGELTVNEEESEIVKYIYEQYISGQSMTKISKKLIEQKIPTKRGGKWCQSTIHSILYNPLYIGKVRYGLDNKKYSAKFEQDGKYEKILDEEVFYNAQEIMKKRKKYDTKKYSSDNTYFLGALRCSVCGARMCAHQNQQTKKDGSVRLYIRYYCYSSGNGNCKAKGFSYKKIDNAFTDYISAIENFKPAPLSSLSDVKNQSEVRNKKINTEIERLERKREKLKELFLSDELTLQEYKGFSNDIRQKINSLRTEIESIQGDEKEVEYNDIESIIGNIKENWGNLSNGEKRQFVHQFISNITAYSYNGEVKITDMEFIAVGKKEKLLEEFLGKKALSA